MLIYPRPEDLRFDNFGGLIEKGAIFNNESRDYLKIEIIDSSQNSYSNYVNRSAGGNIVQSQFTAAGSANLSIKETIYLYIPQTLSESYQQGYNTASIGMLGAGVLNAMGARSDTASMAGEIKQAAMGLKPEAALSAMASGISGVANIAGVGSSLDANGVSQLTRGAILNPYKELIYQGTDFRSHQFSFKMVARDLAQANTINSIISKMRFHMHPGIAGVGGDEEFGTSENTSGTQNGTQSASQAAKTDNSKTSSYNFQGQPTNSDRWLLIPDFFKLTFVRFKAGATDGGSSATVLTKIVQLPVFCVLEGMSINYTPDGQYNPIKRGEDTEEDNGVLAVQMDLQFKETAMLTKVNFDSNYKKQSGSELWKKQTPPAGATPPSGTKPDPNKGNNK